MSLLITGGTGYIGSHTVVELMRQGISPHEACKQAVERIIKKHKDIKGVQVGFIAINKKGQFGSYSVYKGFNYAIQDQHQKDRLVDASYML